MSNPPQAFPTVIFSFHASLLAVFRDGCLFAAQHSTHTHDINTSSLSDDYEKMEAIMNSTLKRTGLILFLHLLLISILG